MDVPVTSGQRGWGVCEGHFNLICKDIQVSLLCVFCFCLLSCLIACCIG